MLEIGKKMTKEKVIAEWETAAKIGSGGLQVFSTPMLVAFMENVAFLMIEKEMSEGETTVGIAMNVKHLKANLVGDNLKCIAVLTKVEGKKLDFDIEVFHNDILVGKGEHTRYIVNSEKFLSKL